MREIKYMAWDIENKILSEVDEICFRTSNVRIKKIMLGKWIDYYYQSFINVELMQYTGLKDRHGKEIYEGYIVKNRHGDLCVIKHSKTGFYPMRNKSGKYSKVTNWDGVISGEVIGNIYENPDILEVTARVKE